MSVTHDIEQTPDTADARPEPFISGKFALYHTPEGGIHAVYQLRDGSRGHHELAPTVVHLIQAIMDSGGMPTPAQALQLLRSMRHG